MKEERKNLMRYDRKRTFEFLSHLAEPREEVPPIYKGKWWASGGGEGDGSLVHGALPSGKWENVVLTKKKGRLFWDPFMGSGRSSQTWGERGTSTPGERRRPANPPRKGEAAFKGCRRGGNFANHLYPSTKHHPWEKTTL